MSGESAQQGIQVNVGKDLSTAIIRGTRLEVSPDSNVVVYTNDGVQTKPAAPVTVVTKEGVEDQQISIGKDFNSVALNGARVELAADGSMIVYTNGTVRIKCAVANDGLLGPPAANAAYRLLSAKAAHEIGAIESTGEHKGEIYGGIWSKEYGGDNKPIWFSTAPRLMDHYDAAAWAEGQGGSVPTRKQGDYLTTLKGKGGAFTELFNRGTSFPGGYIWLAEPNTFNRDDAWCQRLSDGDQFNRSGRYNDLPVLSVRR